MNRAHAWGMHRAPYGNGPAGRQASRTPCPANRPNGHLSWADGVLSTDRLYSLVRAPARNGAPASKSTISIAMAAGALKRLRAPGRRRRAKRPAGCPFASPAAHQTDGDAPAGVQVPTERTPVPAGTAPPPITSRLSTGADESAIGLVLGTGTIFGHVCQPRGHPNVLIGHRWTQCASDTRLTIRRAHNEIFT